MPTDRQTPVSSLVLTAQQLPAPPPKPPCASAGCFPCSCTSISARCTAPDALHTLCRSGSSGKQDLCSGEHHHDSTRQSNSIKPLLMARTTAEDRRSTVRPRACHRDAALSPPGFQTRTRWSFLHLKCPSCSVPAYRRGHATASSAELHKGNAHGCVSWHRYVTPQLFQSNSLENSTSNITGTCRRRGTDGR